MPDIRDALAPFETVLPIIPNINGSIIDFEITEAKQKIYDAQGKTVHARSLVYSAGAYLNPAIDINRDQSLQLNWTHRATDPGPVVEVQIPFTEAPGAMVPQNFLGRETATPKHSIKTFFSTHLHGARTNPASDGWPESLIGNGETKRDFHENHERAKMHWYHDHAMHTTRLNVFAGLAGPYVIRDDAEAGLGLPDKDDRELLLVIQDRNVDVDFETLSATGDHVVNWLHKTETGDGPLEFYGPLNVVNGAVWPVHKVDADMYRLRLLNGANARVFAFRFFKCNGSVIDYSSPIDPPAFKIGTDGGLLPEAMPWSQFADRDALVMMPAERVDLLFDFTPFEGMEIAMVNAATSPFNGSDPGSVRVAADIQPPNPDKDDGRTPYPEVMKFSVGKKVGQGSDRMADIVLNQPNVTGKFYTYDLPKAVNLDNPRTIILVEKDPAIAGQGGAMLTTMEMWPAYDVPILEPSASPPLPYQCFASGPKLRLPDTQGIYTAVAERFQDPVNFQVTLDTVERWRFINLSPDSHPMHIHLVQFKVVRVIQMSEANWIDASGTPVTMDLTDPTNNGSEILNAAFAAEKMVDVQFAAEIAVTETGFKDTVRVDPGTIVEVEAQFKGHLGRYLYHCHLLEHEDHDMMRQFIVTRPDMMHHAMHIPGSIGTKPFTSV